MAILVVNTLSPSATDELRLSVRADHIAYCEERSAMIAQGSRMHSPDGSTLIGGYFLLRTDDPDEARAFCEDDPYTAKGVWATAVYGSVDLPGETEVRR